MVWEESNISTEKNLRINNQIRARQVRLIGAEGEQVGIVSLEDALRQSETSGLDLVEMNPNGDTPVCRIMDYGKFQFQQSKRKAAAKKKQKQVQIKEIKYSPRIEEGDYQVKLRKIVDFLKHGDKVKVTMKFRGREVAHHDIGFQLLERVQGDLVDFGLIEQPPRFEGRQVVMIIGTKKK